MRRSRPSLVAVVAVVAAVALLLAVATPQGVAGAVMAVDFGGEWLKVALVKTGMPMEIVLNRESKRKTPTVLTLHNGDRSVGEDAMALSGRFPRDTYMHLVATLGKLYDEPDSVVFRSRHCNRFEIDANRSTTVLKSDVEDQYWRPEELVAMMLKVAKTQAEAMAGERIKDAVVTVPSWFNQFERQALLDACELAGLNVLRLISSGAATALQYGLAKKYNTTAEYNVFYDMGAGHTQATLVGFSTEKDAKTKKLVPQFEVKAIAFDKTLGGHEFDYRLARYIGEQFMAKNKAVKTDVLKAERPWMKLMKEATRVKQILSANLDTFARVESLADDVDLSVKITRAEFETLCADLFDRVAQPLFDVVKQADLTMDQITSVVIVGGAVRIPRIQAVLKSTFGRDLGQNLNGDEAIVLGAAFKAAELSRQFRVKDIMLRDITPGIIRVRFTEKSDISDAILKQERVLYGALSNLGKRRQITFARKEPFSFEVYQQIGPNPESGEGPSGTERLVQTVMIDGFDTEDVQKLAAANQAPAPKVIVTFELNESGMIDIEKAEAVFEIAEPKDKSKGKAGNKGTKKGQSMFADIYDYFAGSKDKAKEVDGEDLPEREVEEAGQDGQQLPPTQKNTSEQEPPQDQEGNTGSDKENTTESSDSKVPSTEEHQSQPTESETEHATAEASEDPVPEEKVEMIIKQKRSRLRVTRVHGNPRPLTTEEKQISLAKIRELDMHEEKKAQHNTALNNLEGTLYRTRERLDGDTFSVYATAEEREAIRIKVDEISVWFDEYALSSDVPTESFVAKLDDLNSVLKKVEKRIDEATARPKATHALRAALEGVENLIKKIRATDEDDRTFDDEDVDNLDEVIKRVSKWIDEKEAAQNATEAHVDPVVTSTEIGKEIATIEREIKYFRRQVRPSKKEQEKEELLKKKRADKRAKTAKKDDEESPEQQQPPPPVTEEDSPPTGGAEDSGADDGSVPPLPPRDVEDL